MFVIAEGQNNKIKLSFQIFLLGWRTFVFTNLGWGISWLYSFITKYYCSPADVLDGVSPGDFNVVVRRLRLLLALKGQTTLRLLVTFHLLFGQAEQIHRRDQIAEEQDHRLK
jgi:hypothetical protein